jgi:hypothetical protein
MKAVDFSKLFPSTNTYDGTLPEPEIYIYIYIYIYACLINNAILAQTSGAGTPSADPA